MRWNRRLLLLGPSPQSLLPIQLLSHPIVMDRLFFLPQHLFSQLLLLLPLPCLHHPFRILLRIFHLLVSLLILSQVLLLFPFLILPLILIFCLPLLPILLWIDLSPLHPILQLCLYQVLYLLPTPYIDLYPFTLLPGLLAFLWGASLTYTLLFFPPTPYLYLIMAALLPGCLLLPLGLPTVVPKEGPLAAEPGTGSGAGLETIPITPPGGKVPGLPLLAAPFPYFPPGPTLLVIEVTP